MNRSPQDATVRQQILCAAITVAYLTVPVICWLVVPHDPWWQFILTMLIVSGIGWVIGGIALSAVLGVSTGDGNTDTGPRFTQAELFDDDPE